MDIEAIREWRKTHPGPLVDALFAEVERLEAELRVCKDSSTEHEMQEMRWEALAKQLAESQRVLFYALDSALRVIGVGYSAGAAVTLRDQHSRLLTHNPDCDGCVAAAYDASQKEKL